MTKSMFLPFALLMLIGVVTSINLDDMDPNRKACLFPNKLETNRFPKDGKNGLIHAQFAKYEKSGEYDRKGGSCYWLWVKPPKGIPTWTEADKHCRNQNNLPKGFIGGQLAEMDDIAEVEIKGIKLESLLEKRRKNWWVGPQKIKNDCPTHTPKGSSSNGGCTSERPFLCQSFASKQRRCYEYEGWKGGRNQEKVSNSSKACAACITVTKHGKKGAFYKKCATAEAKEECGAHGKDYIPESGKSLLYPNPNHKKFKVECCVGDLCNDADIAPIENNKNEKLHFALTQ